MAFMIYTHLCIRQRSSVHLTCLKFDRGLGLGFGFGFGFLASLSTFDLVYAQKRIALVFLAQRGMARAAQLRMPINSFVLLLIQTRSV
jgi:hypothetical protein